MLDAVKVISLVFITISGWFTCIRQHSCLPLVADGRGGGVLTGIGGKGGSRLRRQVGLLVAHCKRVIESPATNRGAFPCCRYPARLVEISSSQCSNTDFTDRLCGLMQVGGYRPQFRPHRGVIWQGFEPKRITSISAALPSRHHPARRAPLFHRGKLQITPRCALIERIGNIKPQLKGFRLALWLANQRHPPIAKLSTLFRQFVIPKRCAFNGAAVRALGVFYVLAANHCVSHRVTPGCFPNAHRSGWASVKRSVMLLCVLCKLSVHR